MEPKKTTFKIFCKARSDFALTIKDGKARLAPSDILDKKQQWYKIERSYKVEPENKNIPAEKKNIPAEKKNIPAFVLVNKATGQALHHDAKSEALVQLTLKHPYDKDEYLLWIEGNKSDKGFGRVRMACNTKWNLDAHGEGFVENNTKVIVSERNDERADTQLWNIEEYSPQYKIFCERAPGFYLSIRDDRVVLAPANPFDKTQLWYKEKKYSERVKDQDGFKSFALVNKATGKAIKHSAAPNTEVSLVTYKPTIVLDESLLWTESLATGYRTIRVVNNPCLIWDAKGDKVHDGTPLINHPKKKRDNLNQQWNIKEK